MSGQRDRLTGGPSLAVVSFVGLTGLLAFAGPPAQAASASAISAAAFSALAARCAPAVPEWVLGAVARTESNFHPWRLHDNTAHVSDDPPSITVVIFLLRRGLSSESMGYHDSGFMERLCAC